MSRDVQLEIAQTLKFKTHISYLQPHKCYIYKFEKAPTHTQR